MKAVVQASQTVERTACSSGVEPPQTRSHRTKGVEAATNHPIQMSGRYSNVVASLPEPVFCPPFRIPRPSPAEQPATRRVRARLASDVDLCRSMYGRGPLPSRRGLGIRKWRVQTLVGQKTLHIEYLPDIESDGSVAGFYTFSSDVTSLKEVQLRLSKLVRSDSLTGPVQPPSIRESLPALRPQADGLGPQWR